MIFIQYLKNFVEPSKIHESMFVGYLWKNPLLFDKYKIYEISNATFTTDVWSFYYYVGREMYINGVRKFDDTTVYTFLVSRPQEAKKTPWHEIYNEYGGFSTMEEIMNECDIKNKNDEYHFSEIQKYETLRILQDNGMIDIAKLGLIEKLCSMTLSQMQSYFQYQHKKSFAHVNSGDFVEYDLLDEDGISQTIEELEEGESTGIPLFESPLLSKKIGGLKLGDLNYLVLPSGVGKSSWLTEKALLSLLINNEKGIMFINEEGIKRWRTRLLVTVAARILKKFIPRDTVNNGQWKDPKIKQTLNEAAEWLKTHRPDMIKFISMKKYRVQDVINTIELYRPLGYSHILLDTFKPDLTQKIERWLAFSNSATELYDCIKEESQNCHLTATVQLKIGKEFRFLDLDCIGKSGEIVEVASVVMIGRLLYADEFTGVDALQPYRWKYVEQDFGEDIDGKKSSYKKEFIELDPKKTYLVLFLAKNRNGSEAEQIIYEINYDFNTWYEIGYVVVPNYGRKNVS